MTRIGFTTGSCSAAAAKAAAYMLLSGKIKTEITIETPKKIPFAASILEISRSETSVSCCVIKDGGDDPDITTGAHVFAKVSYGNDELQTNKVIIDGGFGVGRVTKPGLDQPVGNSAINSVPRNMITKEVLEVMELFDYHGNLYVEISVPEGVALAEKTFNPRLGIVGGISILGTSGVVEPMSSEALLATIQVELNQKAALGYNIIPVSPGNYGLDFMKRTYDFDLDQSVKSSNFVGETIEMASALQFEAMLFTGHIGKLVKLAGGMMNTHSKYGDCRMELIAASAINQGVPADIVKKLLTCVVTEDAVDVLEEAGYKDVVMRDLMEKIMFHLRKKAGDSLKIECMMYSNKHGLLAKSENATCYLKRIKNDIGKII